MRLKRVSQIAKTRFPPSCAHMGLCSSRARNTAPSNPPSVNPFPEGPPAVDDSDDSDGPPPLQYSSSDDEPAQDRPPTRRDMHLCSRCGMTGSSTYDYVETSTPGTASNATAISWPVCHFGDGVPITTDHLHVASLGAAQYFCDTMSHVQRRAFQLQANDASQSTTTSSNSLSDVSDI